MDRAADNRPGRSARAAFLFVLVSYLLALSVRLHGITTDSPQADELHWRARSRILVNHLRAGELSIATNHLGHPGIPPAFIMGVGQLVAAKYNSARGFSETDSSYLDQLAAARITNASVSSLVVPVLFLAAVPLIGWGGAALAALLLALDPIHIGLSREAHLDSMLTLFVTLSLFTYLAAVRTGRLSLKLLAGAFWGLGICTKPTAAALVAGFLAYRAVRSWAHRRAGLPGERSLISWSDVGAVILGQAMLALFYTRLWVHNSAYRVRLRIKSSLADFLYALGSEIASIPFLSAAFALLTVLLLVAVSPWGRRLRAGAGKKGRNAALLLALLFGLLAFLGVFPQVAESLVRFWAWTIGLSKMDHVAYGAHWTKPEYGYLQLYLTKLPLAVLIGIAAALGLLALSLRSLRSAPSLERATVLIGLLLVVFCWTAPLGVSSKQTIRYVVPVYPALYLLAAFGLVRIFGALCRILGSFRLEPRSIRWKAGYLSAIVLLQCLAGYRWAPDYNLYHNLLGGSLDTALRSGRSLPLAGLNDAIKFLHSRQPFGAMSDILVAVAGDSKVTRAAKRRLVGPGKKLVFVEAKGVQSAEYVMVFEQYRAAMLDKSLAPYAASNPVFEFRKEGVSLLSIYEMPVNRFEQPFFLDTTAAYHRTAGEQPLPKTFFAGLPPAAVTERALVAVPGKNRRDYLFFGEQPRFYPGKYRFSFHVAALEHSQRPEADTPVVRLEAGRVERIVTAGELALGTLKPFAVERGVDQPKRVPIRVYWYGTGAVAVSGVVIERIDTGS